MLTKWVEGKQRQGEYSLRMATYRVANTEKVLIENDARSAASKSSRLRHGRRKMLKLVGKNLLELLVGEDGRRALRGNAGGHHGLLRWCDRDGCWHLGFGVLLRTRHGW